MTRLTVRVAKRVPGFSLNVDWCAGEGVTVLIGPSGSGKSLSLAIVAGLTRPDAGIVALDGSVLTDAARDLAVPAHLRGIGYVSQTGDLFPHMSARGNIAFAATSLPRSDRRARVRDVLESLRLTELAERRPAELSGGQRQRVALARALVRRPKLLVLDEPFSALDTDSRRQVRRVVLDAQRAGGMPVVLVTHELAEAREMADTVVVYSGSGTTGGRGAVPLVRGQGASAD